MTPLDRLRELNSQATPAPWEWHAFDGDTDSTYRGSLYQADQLARYLADGRRSFPVSVLDGEVFADETDATLIVELRNSAPYWLTLEALARDEHHERCGCTGEACKLGEVLRVLDGEA